ncbi:MAG: inorganic diphosphatase [Nannocystaceae bacterium]
MPADLPAIVEVMIEYPRLAMIKRRSDGAIDFVSPVPCPFNYGSIPGFVAGDGDPLDAVVLGARLPLGARVRCRVVGVVDFIDDGCEDPKVICSERPLSPWERRGVELFFAVYACFKGALARLRGSRRTTRFGGWVARPDGGGA